MTLGARQTTLRGKLADFEEEGEAWVVVKEGAYGPD